MRSSDGMKKISRIFIGIDLLLLCVIMGKAAEGQMARFLQSGPADAKERAVMNVSKGESGVMDLSMQDMAKKKVALTFDDGPNANHTGALLDGLKERGVHATFFLLGSQVEKSPELVERMYEDGHLLGNHSYEHVNLSSLSDKAAITQVDLANEAIYQITGEYPEYIRPPYGCWKSNLDYQTTMIEVLWNVDPLDWKTDSVKTIVKRVLKEVEEDDIILLHDASESSVEAALQIIDKLEKKGYVFVTVDEILFD